MIIFSMVVELKESFSLASLACLRGEKIQKVLDSVVVVAFQITFRAEMHVNDIFLFFKNYF